LVIGSSEDIFLQLGLEFLQELYLVILHEQFLLEVHHFRVRFGLKLNHLFALPAQTLVFICDLGLKVLGGFAEGGELMLEGLYFDPQLFFLFFMRLALQTAV
jgi:hypothetical protein